MYGKFEPVHEANVWCVPTALLVPADLTSHTMDQPSPSHHPTALAFCLHVSCWAPRLILPASKIRPLNKVTNTLRAFFVKTEYLCMLEWAVMQFPVLLGRHLAEQRTSDHQHDMLLTCDMLYKGWNGTNLFG